MKSKTYMPLLILIIQLLLFATSCKQTTEPKLEAELKLELEDVSCTEAWIKLTTTNLQLPATVNLLRDGTKAQTINLLVADTVLYVDSLLPNQTYKFQASIQPFNHSGLPAEGRHSSNELTVTTMDTTSHNFTWQSWEFGQHSSSTLYDVAIIDENNIWAVGEIYMLDSLGRPDPNAYNAVHWDGTKWELKRIYTYSNCSSIDYAPLRSIYAFASNKIVVTSGGGMWWFDGNRWIAECSINPLLTGAINKLWGSSSEDLYAVGNNGNIAHWDGVRWRKIESGTTLNINDIWGDYNSAESDYEIIFIAAQQFVGPERNIYRIVDKSVEKLSTLNINQGSIHGIWFKTGRKYYVVGNGIYTTNNVNYGSFWDASLINLTPYYTYAIRGSALNNVLICGSFGELLHYNGFTWQSFQNMLGFFNADFFNIDVKENVTAVVGQKFNSGIIVIGKTGL
ncbi:glucosyl transferase [Ignavibacterium sp.]|uniref:glucosyl transferase n=1 Tax=Ignavibacterium sp. TaxID=2651167 RepID=UPI00220FAAD5|nr:glucosyl transferase [Ignavibacterium sp.]BDQ02995.1 MAG: hypothetical protein KatS3mg037_1570 [Ignavibacterium sp.]